jgi:hypothetical protein
MQDHSAEGCEGYSVPCCPNLVEHPPCESIDIRYRLPYRSPNSRFPVELILHFRFERCAGPLSLGDIVHTTTLLPGEKVRLFTSDRHSRFSYDEIKQLAYRHATTSEESYFMAGMAHAASSFVSLEATHYSSLYAESAVSGGGGAGIDLGIIEIGGSASASGFTALTVTDFARAAASHAQSSSRHVEAGVRAASSTSIGEVQTRTHAQGQSEDHFESASRVFENPNHCHAISFFFYKLMKQQTVRFTLEAVERRLIDQAAPIDTRMRVPAVAQKVSIRPETVSATHPDRIAIERRDRESLAERRFAGAESASASMRAVDSAAAAMAGPAERVASMKAVDSELRQAGLVDQTGAVAPSFRASLSWERTVLLPTSGVIVKGCLDDCDICEPEEKRRRELELERMALKNKLLARRIELLDKELPSPEPEPEPVEG